MTAPTTRTLEVPNAVLTYDIRSNADSAEPPLMLIGSPMGASGFQTLSSLFPDRTVVTYDPRGVERSRRTDRASETQVEEHADDLHRVIAALGRGPVDLFASSGGAVNALALVERHPEDVRTLVAHEPPACTVLPDRVAALAAVHDIHDTYLRRGRGPAMAKFIALVMVQGEVPADWTSQPAPDPAMFHLPTEDDGARDDPLLGQNMMSCNSYELDVERLRAASTRIVLAAGEESAGTLAHRGAVVVAERLGTSPVIFPSGHGGFIGDEYGPGQAGKPQAFAARLREVLARAAAPTTVAR
ncbi:MAG: alpha/beta hydrolase [Chloroflexi bacterium]|nr:alpha/beta hydrolase [Chloroflexota bacterium]